MRTSDAETRPAPRLRGAAAVLAALAAAAFTLCSPAPAAAKGGSHNSQHATGTLRGGSGDDRKGGRYLAPAAKKLPGKRKPPTLTLKRGKTSE